MAMAHVPLDEPAIGGLASLSIRLVPTRRSGHTIAGGLRRREHARWHRPAYETGPLAFASNQAAASATVGGRRSRTARVASRRRSCSARMPMSGCLSP